jgi:acetyltransferase-like isoleucine patch superfamily enzyme
VYYNFFRKNVIRDKNCYILPIRGTRIELHKTAKIVLHANLHLNVNKYPHSKAECYLRLREGAEMVVNGSVSLFYNATIEVHGRGRFAIGQSSINSGAVIICAYKMTIGSGCLIARYAMISDSDHHRTFDDNGRVTNYPKEVVIGDNVWLGIKSTVMRGSRIKSGSVVGADSLIMGKIKEHTLMMNEPAREFSKINWSTEGFEDDR